MDRRDADERRSRVSSVALRSRKDTASSWSRRGRTRTPPSASPHVRSFHGIHNVVDRGVLQAMWEEHAGKVGHRDQLIIC